MENWLKVILEFSMMWRFGAPGPRGVQGRTILLLDVKLRHFKSLI